MYIHLQVHGLILIAVILISVDHKVYVVWVMLQPLEDLVPGGQLTPQSQIPVSGAPARPHESLRINFKYLQKSYKIFKYLGVHLVVAGEGECASVGLVARLHILHEGVD